MITVVQQLTTTVERLLSENEGFGLDFKETQYRFAGATDAEKGEVIKDILAFANASRRDDAFILLGVREVQGGRAIIIGVSEHLADADLQQLVNSKTNRPVHFSYHSLQIEDKQVGVIRIPRQERPIYLKKAYGRLEADAVYLRRGSSTSKATLEEVAQMGIQPSAATDPEAIAVGLLLQHARFAERVWQLIQDISRIPHHFITNIARPPAYDAAKRDLWNRFNEDYTAFRRDLSTATDILRELAATGRSEVASLVEAAQEACTTVESFVGTAHETYATQHAAARTSAFAAAERLSSVLAKRLIAINAG